MGSSNTKDKNIDIYLQVTKPFHFAGDYVQGFVYINAKTNCSYVNLFIRLEGEQYVYWTQGSGKHKKYYTNKKQTYTDEFILTKFQNGVVPKGHYNFPFSFLLPRQMSGSYFQTEKGYIRYPLMAYLSSSDGKNDNQMFSLFLNIIEPFRGVLSPANFQQVNTPKCCGCCKGYGKTIVALSCDKNYVKPGDQIFVQGYVDNTAGKKKIQDVNVRFKQNRIKIASTQKTDMKVDYKADFFKLNKPIYPGQTQNFSFYATIPEAVYSTSIGSITAKYFTLGLNSSIGCCSTGPYSNIHLVFTSTTPRLQIKPQIQPPSNWCPVTYPGIVYNNMKPFIYQPQGKIPYHNRGFGNDGNVGFANLQNMNMGYFNNNFQTQNKESNSSSNNLGNRNWEDNGNDNPYSKLE